MVDVMFLCSPDILSAVKGYAFFRFVSAKLHYTDTGYGHVVQHHQRTRPTDELTTSCRCCTNLYNINSINSINTNTNTDVLYTDELTTIIYNFLYNKFTTNGQKFSNPNVLTVSRCWALAMRCGKFVVQQVVELL